MSSLELSNVLTILVLAATIALIVARLPRLNEGIVAVLGAVGVLALGTATLADVWRGIVDTAAVLVFLIAMMVVAVIAEEAGCFEWAAQRAVRLSRGRGGFLFLNLYLLGALTTVFLSLDVTAIMIAPIVCALVRRARLSPLPFVLACAYVANNASLFLPVSNLTNMLVYSMLRVSFWSFVGLLTLPNLAAIAVNLVVFWLIFRRVIPSGFTEQSDSPFASRTEPKDPGQLRFVALGLLAVIVGLIAFGALGWPLYLPAVVGAVLLAGTSIIRRAVSIDRVVGGIAWPLPLFVVGMYTVVVAANRVGLGTFWHGVLSATSTSTSLPGLLVVAFGTSIGANLVNNLPMSLVAITALNNVTSSGGLAVAFASLIGTNVGANMTVFGSLATMLVLNTARRYDIYVRSRDYVLIGLLTTPLMVLASTLVLWLQLRS